MLDAHLYYAVYLAVVTICSIFVVKKPSSQVNGNNALGLVLMLFMILFIGFRPQSGVFIDMMNYIQNYHAFFENVPFHWDANAENFLFDNYFAFVGSQNLGTTFFL